MPQIDRTSAAHLRSFVERIERLEEEKKSIADDIREIYAEAKGTGFDVKALREIVRLRKQDKAEREEHQAIVETYMHALGMLADTPLGEAAIERAEREAKDTRKRVDRIAEQAKSAGVDPDRVRTAAKKAAASPSVRRAVKALGTPVPLTEKERQKGQMAAFVGKDGTRMSIGLGLPRQDDLA